MTPLEAVRLMHEAMGDLIERHCNDRARDEYYDGHERVRGMEEILTTGPAICDKDRHALEMWVLSTEHLRMVSYHATEIGDVEPLPPVFAEVEAMLKEPMKGRTHVTNTLTMYKGSRSTASGTPITEPNDVTRMLDQAYALGYTVRVQNPDSASGKMGARCADAREAWGKVLEHHMEVDDDFLVHFEKPGEPVHWMFFVTGGGNMPDDGWMNDGCAGHGDHDCTALEPLWDAMQ